MTLLDFPIRLNRAISMAMLTANMEDVAAGSEGQSRCGTPTLVGTEVNATCAWSTNTRIRPPPPLSSFRPLSTYRLCTAWHV